MHFINKVKKKEDSNMSFTISLFRLTYFSYNENRNYTILELIAIYECFNNQQLIQFLFNILVDWSGHDRINVLDYPREG